MDDADSPLQTLALVEFRVGDCRLAVEASSVVSLLEGPSHASHSSVSRLLGLPETSEVARRVLVILAGGKQRSVQVDGPVELRDVPVNSIYPLPELILSRMAINGARALVLMETVAIVVVDLSRLLVAAHSVGATQSGE